MKFLNDSNKKPFQKNQKNCYCLINNRLWFSRKHISICFDKRSSLQHINKDIINLIHEKYKCFKNQSVKYKIDLGIKKYDQIFSYHRNLTFHFVDSNLYMNYALKLGINSKPKANYHVAIVDFNEKSVYWMQTNLTTQSFRNLKVLST
jgi:hypothetical protein